mmetsp:Transcript_8998/g.23470  ORF Transcript_8998/g.23470 Transcript_8998/m.23470 type:complete len:206 (-) Transcript_8998:128-745(-)
MPRQRPRHDSQPGSPGSDGMHARAGAAAGHRALGPRAHGGHKTRRGGLRARCARVHVCAFQGVAGPRHARRIQHQPMVRDGVCGAARARRSRCVVRIVVALGLPPLRTSAQESHTHRWRQKRQVKWRLDIQFFGVARRISPRSRCELELDGGDRPLQAFRGATQLLLARPSVAAARPGAGATDGARADSGGAGSRDVRRWRRRRL